MASYICVSEKRLVREKTTGLRVQKVTRVDWASTSLNRCEPQYFVAQKCFQTCFKTQVKSTFENSMSFFDILLQMCNCSFIKQIIIIRTMLTVHAAYIQYGCLEDGNCFFLVRKITIFFSNL